MTLCSPEKLVIFDYSGTLSLEAPRFARPVNLLSALAESGLAKLGVATLEAFWGEIVGPTWTRGSTTTTGYKRVMAERIEALGLAPDVAGAEIAEASSRFVDFYLDHSRIDPRWRPMLETLAGNPGACVVIATDHYAEATETIIHNLNSWNIPARKAGEEAEPRFPLFIANKRPVTIAISRGYSEYISSFVLVSQGLEKLFVLSCYIFRIYCHKTVTSLHRDDLSTKTFQHIN